MTNNFDIKDIPMRIDTSHLRIVGTGYEKLFNNIRAVLTNCGFDIYGNPDLKLNPDGSLPSYHEFSCHKCLVFEGFHLVGYRDILGSHDITGSRWVGDEEQAFTALVELLGLDELPKKVGTRTLYAITNPGILAYFDN